MSSKRWIKFQNSLIGFKPKFEHIKGKYNILVDWLSRQIINNVDNANDWFYFTWTWLKENPLKLEPFNLEPCLNKVLNPNLRFNSLYSQNLFEEYKVIEDNFLSLKPQSFPNQNLEYAYGKIVSALAQHLQNLQNQLIALETHNFKTSKSKKIRKNW